ncbi:MAG: hypothetical protein P8L45_11150 [Longimicrobiales bacterium]|nr:hypothetical protein [Longimicrobiales bacterium]
MTRTDRPVEIAMTIATLDEFWSPVLMHLSEHDVMSTGSSLHAAMPKTCGQGA